MKNRIYLITLLFIATSLSFAQTNSLNFDFDYAAFKGFDGNTRIEFYFSFYQPTLKKMNFENQSYTSASISLKVFDQQSNIVFSKNGKFESVYDSTSNQKNLIGKIEFELLPQQYRLMINAKDNFDSTSFFSSQLDFNVSDYSSSDLNLSDLELAGQIVQSDDTNSIFYKNTFEIEPNPTKVFSMNFPVVFYYFEIYNVFQPIEVSYKVLNSNGVEKFRKNRNFNSNSNSIADVGTIKISDFVSGVYTLVVDVKDGSKSTNISKKFYVYNPNKIDSNQISVTDTEDILHSDFFALSEEELDLIFKKSEYIAAEAEKKDWKRLTNIEAKRKFLDKFWKARDENPSTPINESKISYFDRVAYSQSKFSGLSNKDGWLTDRGRVYIIYGKPSEIERYPNESEKKPYEIWRYENLEGGVVFIFADLFGYSDYKLIHSTKRGEVSLPNWEEKITQ